VRIGEAQRLHYPDIADGTRLSNIVLFDFCASSVPGRSFNLKLTGQL